MERSLAPLLTDLGAPWCETAGGIVAVEAEHGNVGLVVLEKRGAYATEWIALFGGEERYLVLVEEILARRLLRCAPYAFLLVCETGGEACTVFSAVDLLCMPKQRVERFGGGVWLLDRRNGHLFATVSEAVRWCLDEKRTEEFFASTGCYRRYNGEVIPER